MNPIITLDLETTGLNPKKHGIIEIFARASKGEKFFLRVAPLERHIWDERAEAVHGITESEAKRGSSFKEALVLLADFVSSHYDKAPKILGFNPHFDLSFLVEAYESLGLSNPFSHRLVDINSIGEAVLGTDNSTDICTALGIEIDTKKKHSAEYDCYLALECFKELKNATV